MSLEENIRKFSESIPNKLEHIETEETTKTALILPFLRIMGYDTEDPSEVKAEFTADIGAKKGEKIDMAIFIQNKAEILIECKAANGELDINHISQLYRYYNITNSKIGLLTNGILYKFFTDSQNQGKMDNSPFMEINLLDIKDSEIKELEKFTKEKFNIKNIMARVDDLKYTNDIKKCLNNEIEMPSDEFVKVIAKQVYDGILTQKVKHKFSKIIRNNFKQVIDEKVDKRLKEALENIKEDGETILLSENNDDNDGIITTKEELEGYYIVKSLLSKIIDVERVAIRDHKTYCSILLDNNKHYPICRMYFNNPKNMKLGFFDSFEKDDKGRKKQTQTPIQSVNDINNHDEKLLKTVRYYERLKENKEK